MSVNNLSPVMETIMYTVYFMTFMQTRNFTGPSNNKLIWIWNGFVTLFFINTWIGEWEDYQWMVKKLIWVYQGLKLDHTEMICQGTRVEQKAKCSDMMRSRYRIWVPKWWEWERETATSFWKKPQIVLNLLPKINKFFQSVTEKGILVSSVTEK